MEGIAFDAASSEKGATEKLRIRPALESDLKPILAMIRQLAEFEHLAAEVTATEQDLRRWLTGPQAVASALAGEWDGQVVAYAIYFRTFSTFLAKPGLYLEDLFVKEEFRDRGIGRAMLACLAAMTVRQGYGRLQWAALSWNKNAIRLYERLGAVAETEWTGYRLTGEALKRLATERPRP